MKKAQTEVIGLLVIVILFIVIFFFYISFSGQNNDNRELRQSVESSYFLRAMMFYTPVNCDKQIKEIIEDCRTGNVICSMDCKELLDKEIGNILDKLDRDYRFSIKAQEYEYNRLGSCNTGIADSFNTRNIEAKILMC